jgi:hypothetical protein
MLVLAFFEELLKNSLVFDEILFLLKLNFYMVIKQTSPTYLK